MGGRRGKDDYLLHDKFANLPTPAMGREWSEEKKIKDKTFAFA